jgi:LPXTG-motif cell wall-anchored protein
LGPPPTTTPTTTTAPATADGPTTTVAAAPATTVPAETAIATVPGTTVPQPTTSLPAVTTKDISGIVFIDTDGDGRRGPNERTIAGAVVTIRLPDGRVITATTDQNGRYVLRDVPFGEHPVTVTIDDKALVVRKSVIVEGESASDLDIPATELSGLAFTGTESRDHTQLAFALLMLGLFLVVLTRRRKDEKDDGRSSTIGS